ncbi:MAG: hypothetical protein ABW123_28945 [Cystobacter sp.]
MNPFISVGILWLALGTAPVAPSAPGTSAFTATYQGGNSSCESTQALQGWEPTAPGTHPVFVYLVGTWEPYDNASALAIVSRMAERGYVAATVDYSNWTFGNCATLTARSRCIFNENSPRSAIQHLCARTKADCSRGIVVSGFSQGSILAILSRNHDSRIRAVFAMSAGVQYAGYNLRSCVTPTRRSLTPDRLRAIDGESDHFLGRNERSVRAQLTELTGAHCPAPATSCSGDKTSGWHIVSHSEVTDGDADHCYIRTGGCTGNSHRMDPQWLTGTHPWSLGTNLDWLTSFTTP